MAKGRPARANSIIRDTKVLARQLVHKPRRPSIAAHQDLDNLHLNLVVGDGDVQVGALGSFLTPLVVGIDIGECDDLAAVEDLYPVVES